jgi:hypothetical protein
MIAFAVASTGWTWREVEEQMTWPRWRALEEEWRLRPPLTWVVPAALGWKAPDKKAAKPAASAPRAASIADLDAMFPNGRFRGS